MDAQTLFLHAARHHQDGNLTKAIAMYRESLAIIPDNGNATLYLGLALQQVGHFIEAETAFKEAVRLLPNDPDALNGYGVICLTLGKVQEAQAAHMTALKANPMSSEALDGLGNVLLSQGHLDAAIDTFTKSLDINPDAPDTLSNLGVALKTANRPKEALEQFEASLRLYPDSADTQYNLGNAWQMRGDMKRARQSYMQAQGLNPWAVAPRWGGCFAQLNMLYDTDREVTDARKQYAHSLEELDEFLTLTNPDQIREAVTVVGANQPFYLTYQGQNDRELQSRYGGMVHRIMTTAYPQFATQSFDSGSHDKIRVGIVTGFMHEHSVWKIPTRGWACHMDREKFEVHGYYTGVKSDACTAEAKRIFTSFTHLPHDFEGLCNQILADDLDVLIYPDIGMDPTCAKLAGLRLAPNQCVSLGHPMTTGLPTIDYYLSSDLMEPEDGELAYTEQLVRLPNLSVLYEPLRQGEPQFTRGHFGLPENGLLYFCPQALYKYLPDYDRLYPLIAKQVPNSKFIFLENATADIMNEQFKTRMARSFDGHGLSLDDHVTMLPYQGPDEFHALNCLCDVFLDSIEWSGFNTTMEAANAGLPAITWPRTFMRGRHAYAVIKMLGNDDAIAASFEDYVALAVRMGTDAQFRLKLRDATLKNRDTLFGDMEPIRGLEAFITKVVRHGS